MLVARAPSEDIRCKSLNKLLDLAEMSESNGWASDVEIFEALLEALHMVHGVVNQKKDVEMALRKMSSFQQPRLIEAYSQWLGQASLCDKLASTSYKEGKVESGHIFRMGEEETIDNVPGDDRSKYEEELKELYQAADFAEVFFSIHWLSGPFSVGGQFV